MNQSDQNARSTALRFVTLAALVVILDQLTKFLVLTYLSTSEQITIIPGLFNLVLTYNPGVAFGMFAGLDDTVRVIVLTITTLLAFGVLFYLFTKEYRTDPIAQAAISLILGGAIGNIIDRIRIGMVVDFLDFYWNSYHWPAFNLADSAICIGVAILILRPKQSEHLAESR